MTPRQRRIYELSRDNAFLTKASLLILGSCLLIGFVVSLFSNHEDWMPQEVESLELYNLDAPPLPLEPQVADFLDSELADLPWILELLIQADPDKSTLLAQELAASSLSEDEKTVAKALLGLPAESLKKVVALTQATPTLRYAHYAHAVWQLQHGEEVSAARALEQEGLLFPEAVQARELALYWYLETESFNDLERLSTEPVFQNEFSYFYRVELATVRNEWHKVLLYLMPYSYEHLSWTETIPAIIVMLTWFLLCMQWAHLQSRDVKFMLQAVAGVLLGAASAVMTLFVVIWQKEVWGFYQGEDLLGNLIYYFAGVGLREEFIKLLFFTPLLWISLKSRDEMRALILASCVGLGFAVEENLSYYISYGTEVSIGRFLTANFFHMSATGLCGLALFRVLAHRIHWDDMLYLFLIVVCVHGAYDSLIIIPELSDFAIFSLTIYVYLCLYYFNELKSLRSAGRNILSLKASFLLGLCSLVGLLVVMQSWTLGLHGAINMIGFELTGLGIIIYMFMREFDQA
ncbi:MAG: PrsW family glutamic-type intramembrane protease [Verrucomicrobiota bacterium]